MCGKIKEDHYLVLICVFFTVIIWLYLMVYAIQSAEPPSLASMGQLGDSFGAINWLIGTLTLIAVFFTYRSQKEQLQIEKANGEMDGFDRIYQSHRNLVASTEHMNQGEIFRGNAAFNHEYERLMVHAYRQRENLQNGKETQTSEAGIIKYAKFFRDGSTLIPPKDTNLIKEVFRIYYNEAKPRVAVYFSSLAYTIQSAQKVTKDNDKETCLKLIRSQLSPQECVLIFYYTLTYPDKPLSKLATDALLKDTEVRNELKESLLHSDHLELIGAEK